MDSGRKVQNRISKIDREIAFYIKRRKVLAANVERLRFHERELRVVTNRLTKLTYTKDALHWVLLFALPNAAKLPKNLRKVMNSL